MKRLLTSWLWLLLTPLALANNVPDSLAPATPKNGQRAVLKLAPLALLEFQNTFEIGLEVPLTNRVYVQGQLGYSPQWLMWNYSPTVSARYTERENWRARLEFRWYGAGLGRTARQTNSPLGDYLAVDGFFKQLNGNESITVGRQCANGNCAYFENLRNPTTRYSVGIGLKFGSQRTIYRFGPQQNRRLVLDSYVGFGVRYAWTASRLVPLASEQVFRQGFDFLVFDPFRATNGLTPNPIIGIKLGYIL